MLGLDVASAGPMIRERVGYMPEHDCLPPDVPATDFVVHLARMSGLPATAARERTADVLRHVGLYAERYRPIGDYSTGMRQRVKLAQALVHDPQLASSTSRRTVWIPPAITERVLGSSAGTLGVASAVSFATGVALLAVVVAGCTWFAGSRLRTLPLTGSE